MFKISVKFCFIFNYPDFIKFILLYYCFLYSHKFYVSENLPFLPRDLQIACNFD